MRKNVNLFIQFLVVLALMTTLYACSSFEKNAYTTLESVQALWTAGMETSADMAVANIITEEDYVTVSGIGEKVAAVGIIASKSVQEYADIVETYGKDSPQAASSMTIAVAALKALVSNAQVFREQIETLAGEKLPLPDLSLFEAIL